MMRALPNPIRRAAALVRRFAADTRGVTAVEFGLGATVMFLITMGIMDVSRALQTMITLEHAVKVGGRFAVIEAKKPGATLGTVKFATVTKMKAVAAGLDPTKLTGNVSWSGAQAANTPVIVAAAYPHEFFFNSVISATPITFTSSSRFVIGN